MQGETAPESETPILKECILRDGEEFCRTVSPDGMASAPAEVAADTDYLAWARPFLNDPVGWANENVLNLDILVPLSIQVGSVLLALVVGVLLAPPIRKQVLGLRMPVQRLVFEAAGPREAAVPQREMPIGRSHG